jgi:opacity protein-like surface antigen
MKSLLATATAVALLAGSSFAAQAQTPGLDMQQKGSVKGTTGASGYAPGHKMQEKGSVKGTTGASGYAPGHATTGAAVNSDADVKAGQSRATTGASVGGSAKVK